MIRNLLKMSKYDKPYITIILVLSCLLSTIGIGYFPESRLVLDGVKPITYPWQRLTAVFINSSSNQIGMGIVELLSGNLTVLIFFGVLVENLLGKSKYALLVVAALFINILLTISQNAYGNGISGLTYALIPVVLIIMYLETRNGIKESIENPFIYIYAFLLLGCLLITPIMTGANLYHEIAQVVGGVFSFVWLPFILKKSLEITNNKLLRQYLQKTDKWFIGGFLLIPACITLLIIFSSTNLIKDFKPRLQYQNIITKISPPPHSEIELINKAGKQITLEFSNQMNTSFDSSILLDGKEDLFITYKWAGENKTLHIVFNRPLNSKDKFKGSFTFMTVENTPLPPLLLEYRNNNK